MCKLKNGGGEFRRLAGRTAFLLLMVIAVFPLLYLFVDVVAAEYVRYQISSGVVQLVKRTSNYDDYINISCVGMALYAWFRMKNQMRARWLLLPPMASLLSGVLTHMLKWPLGRWRPKDYFDHQMFGFEFMGPVKVFLFKHLGIHSIFCDLHPFARSGRLISFPSGHTSSMMGIMAAIAMLNPKFRWPCFIAAIFFGIARVIEGAHYCSDILGGLVLGYLSAHWLRYLLVNRGWLSVCAIRPLPIRPHRIPGELPVPGLSVLCMRDGSLRKRIRSVAPRA